MLSRGIRSLSSFTNGIGWGISLPQLSAPGGVAVTKYRITRPYKEDTTWDDFLLALPEREQLATFTKETPLFVRYLKLVTDKEGRHEAFRSFYSRCKDGLTVESDVFLTAEELLALMWKNGYSEQERNSLQFTFPSDYRFHYPELSALFDISEEDAYKFCMRARMDKSHIGELSWDKMKPRAFLRDHWLLYAGGWFVFKNYPFFNYAFFLKTWGFSVWFVSSWLLFSRAANKIWKRNEFLAQQKTAEAVMEGEDAIVKSMRRFAHDGKAIDFLKSFKPDLESELAQFRQAFANQQMHAVSERILQQLEAVSRAEAGMGAALQETIVKESVDAFKSGFSKDQELFKKTLSYAIDALAGKKGEDPVLKFFTNSIQQAEQGAKAKPDINGSVAERLAFATLEAENNFKKNFTVSSQEAKEVCEIAQIAKSGQTWDFSKLDAKASAKLEQLYNTINDRVGFVLPHENSLTELSGNTEFETTLKMQLEDTKRQVKHQRLSAFVGAF